jgi:hypothetical protein
VSLRADLEEVVLDRNPHGPLTVAVAKDKEVQGTGLGLTLSFTFTLPVRRGE